MSQSSGGAEVVVYRCQRCGGPGRILNEPWIRERVLSCGGQLELIHILRAFEDAADGVFVAHCDPDRCGSLAGSARAASRVESARSLLEEAGVRGGRLRALCCGPQHDLTGELRDFHDTLRQEGTHE